MLAEARRSGIPEDWLEAAQNSPVYDLCCRYDVALPLHPGVPNVANGLVHPAAVAGVDALTETGHDGEDIGNLFRGDAMRILIEYLAELFTAGDIDPVNDVLRKLAAMRSHMRTVNLGEAVGPSDCRGR